MSDHCHSCGFDVADCQCTCEDCHGEGTHEQNIPASEDGPERDVEVYCHCPIGQEKLLAEDTTGYAAEAKRRGWL